VRDLLGNVLPRPWGLFTPSRCAIRARTHRRAADRYQLAELRQRTAGAARRSLPEYVIDGARTWKGEHRQQLAALRDAWLGLHETPQHQQHGWKPYPGVDLRFQPSQRQVTHERCGNRGTCHGLPPLRRAGRDTRQAG